MQSSKKLTWMRFLVILILFMALVGPAAVVKGTAPEAAPFASPLPPVGESGLSFAYDRTIGQNETPYLADNQHLNQPSGLYRDPATGDIYVVENRGSRVIKYNASGVYQMQIGKPGVSYQGEGILDHASDAALDAAGRIWVAEYSHLTQFNQQGEQVQNLPGEEPWRTGSEHGRFDEVAGVAFDTAGHLFVSDRWNHRVEVYTFDAASNTSPVYWKTIGVTREPGSDQAHFNQPGRLAVDSSGALFVVDQGNNRVQKCVFDEIQDEFTCATFDAPGEVPYSVTVDASDAVYISYPWQTGVRKCTGGTCTQVTEYSFGEDIVVDSAGILYLARPDHAAVEKYDSLGNSQGVFAGVWDVPYLNDDRHFEHPVIGMDPSGALLVAEYFGQRLHKLSPLGEPTWSFGEPGIDFRWYEPEKDQRLLYPAAVTAASDGRIYTGERGRIQVFSPDGVLQDTWSLETLGVSDIAGLAFSPNGRLYVSDSNHHRVMIFNESKQLLGQLGVTGECGRANDHFCAPNGLAFDSAGNLYVAEAWNNRVKKIDPSGQVLLVLGVTAEWGDDNAHFSEASDVAVDAQGRIYVADRYNQRVQVFDAQGRYQASLLGAYGAGPFRGRDVSSVEVDANGVVYVGDTINHAILRFVPGPRGWRQSNVSGFGDRRTNAVTALAEYQGSLYAGTAGWNEEENSGIRLWNSADGKTWQAETTVGLDGRFGGAVTDLLVFDGKLYASTAWGNNNTVGNRATIWRMNGGQWESVLQQPYSDDLWGFSALGAFQENIYASTNGSGLSIFRSSSGDTGSWQEVVTDGRGSANNERVNDFAEFNGALYAAVKNANTNVQIWRTLDGTNWSTVVDNGFGQAGNGDPGGFTIFKGNLYVALHSDSGGQLWRSANGTDWTPVTQDGFGDPSNQKIEGVIVYQNAAYAMTNNDNGMQVWRSYDGVQWTPVELQGFGTGQNFNTLWTHASTVFQSSLFIGTWNNSVGGQVWRMEPWTYLPAIFR